MYARTRVFPYISHTFKVKVQRPLQWNIVSMSLSDRRGWKSIYWNWIANKKVNDCQQALKPSFSFFFFPASHFGVNAWHKVIKNCQNCTLLPSSDEFRSIVTYIYFLFIYVCIICNIGVEKCAPSKRKTSAAVFWKYSTHTPSLNLAFIFTILL